MSSIVFALGTDIIMVTVKDKTIYFTDHTGTTTLDGLKLSKVGVEKEFPELIGNPHWRFEVIKKFKDKIKSFESEREIINYLMDDLRKYGYIPKKLNKDGFRTKNLK